MATCPDRPEARTSSEMVAEDHSPDGPVPWLTTLIPADGHAVPVRVFTPPQPSGWLVWAHGGSWRWGSVEQWHAPCADLAVRSRCVVVSVDYRLAPQHRHPAPVDDVLTAMRWAQQQMAHQGTPPAMLAVGGDSAGGTLAATAALAWRDRGRPLAAQLLAYPPLDPACRAASYATVGQFPVRSVLRAAWAAHLGSAADRSRAVRYRSPLHTENLAALAPAILAVGDLDPVRDDVWAYAQRLQETGVPVRFRAFTDTPHGAFLDPDPQIAPTAAGQQEPSLRAWLASSLRHQLDHPAAADHTIP